MTSQKIAYLYYDFSIRLNKISKFVLKAGKTDI